MTFLGDHLLQALLLLPLLGAASAGVAPRAAVRWIGHAVAAAELILVLLAMLLPSLGIVMNSPETIGRLGKAEVAVGLRWNVPAGGLSLVIGGALVAWMLLGWEHRPPRRRDVALALLATAFALLVVLGSSGVTVVVGAILSSAVCVLALLAARETTGAALLSVTHSIAAATLLVVAAADLRDEGVISPGMQAVWVLLAALLRLGFPPMHGAWASAAGAGSGMARAMVNVSAVITSGVLLLTLLPADGVLRSGWALAGAIGMVYGGFVAMGAGSIGHVAVGLHVAGGGLVLCSAAAGDAVATALAIVALAIGPSSLLLIGRSIERRLGTDRLESLGGLSASMPTALMLAIASSGVSALLPITGGFVALLLVSSRLAGEGAIGWSCVVLASFSFVLLTCAATRLVRRVFFGPGGARPAAPSDLRWWETASVTLLLLLAVVYGVAPGLLGAR